MSEHIAIIAWENHQEVFTDNRYSREHQWTFDGGTLVNASASPDVVPIPYSNPSYVDPEEAFVAALSSCHMLLFLSIAAKRSFIVQRYTDRSIGQMAKNEAGKLAITTVRLNPEISFIGNLRPTAAQIAEIHHEAHQNCYLANSVTANITIGDQNVPNNVPNNHF